MSALYLTGTRYKNKKILFKTAIGLAALYGINALRKYIQRGALSEKPSKQNTEKRVSWFNTIDKASLSNLDAVTTLHHSIHLRVLFSQKIVVGRIEYVMQAQQPLSEVLLDVKSLDIESVEYEGKSAQYRVVEHVEHQEKLGSQLVVQLQATLPPSSKFNLTVRYRTSAQGSGESSFSWLTPEQTVGGRHPYVFTQAEPIYARTIFPCQDSPSVKATFECAVEVEGGLVAYVSGLKLVSSVDSVSGGTVHRFEQTVPIPSYLFALVAGNLEERSVSQRCAVISEPEALERAALELEDLESYVHTIEEYTRIPYLWKAYKIVVLPASFPYGGMENPLLTFASPTIIVGDKSQTGVAIHEIAHSWSGNLVSCKNWECFWLNEGWTVFLELKAIRTLRGQGDFSVKRYLRALELRQAVDKFGVTNSYTSLCPDLAHNNPDDAFSAIPYNKGSQFLEYVESIVGEEAFRDFVTQYFKNYQFKSLDTAEFTRFLKQHFGQATYRRFQTDEWLCAPGYAPVGLLEVESIEVQEIKALTEQFFSDEEAFYAKVLSPAKGDSQKTYFESLSSDLKVIFLEGVYEQRQKLTVETLARLEQRLTLNTSATLSRDAEIQSKWLKIAIATHYTESEFGHATMKRLEIHLSSIGRMKYLRPLYQELVRAGLIELGRGFFKRYENFYHSIAANMIRADLKLN